MKNNFFYTILFLSLFFISCKKDYEKNSKKMLAVYNEDKCSEYMDFLFQELNDDKYYVWNGSNCELSFSDNLQYAMDNLVEFHKNHHTFIDKKGNFDERKWNDWMHFYNFPDEIENPNALFTNCFICLQKNDDDDKANFDSKLENNYYKTLIYNSYFGMNVKEKELQITKHKKAEIEENNILNSMYKAVENLYVDMPEKVKITKAREGKYLYVYSNNDIVNVTTIFQCTKTHNGYNAQIESVSFEVGGITQTRTIDRYDPWDVYTITGYLLGVLEKLKEL